ncbi:prepilin-type N-terminal cleavage/methylation domain-containing protein [Hydrogenimonas sp.]
MPRAFTLVELLVVLLLMGMIYAIAFNNFLPGVGEKSERGLSLATVDTLFKNSPLYRHEALTLYGTAGKRAYLVAGGKVVQTVSLPESGVGYRLNPDETLQNIDYPHIKLGTDEFVPSFVIRCRATGLFDPQILMVGEKWLYIHPTDAPRLFDNPADMVAHMRRSDYLPDKAGYAL